MSADVVLVDWLGRGGIAQTSQAWVQAMTHAGLAVLTVTRRGRELAGEVTVAERVLPRPLRALDAHRRLVRAACHTIREHRPALVVVQNFVIPTMESEIAVAARAVGARLVTVVHDHRHHSRLSGSTRGLARLLEGAHEIVCHSRFVADRLEAGTVPVTVVPHPIAIGVVGSRRPADDPLAGLPTPRLVHFGILRRRYKGTALVAEVGVRAGWHVVLCGVGAPALVGTTSMDRFLDPAELAAVVATSDAAVLPYRAATQSGAVALAMALGTVPVASAVGGIPEQIHDGEDGLLVPAGAELDAWVAALEQLADPDLRARLGARARARSVADHARFTERVPALVR